MVVRPPGPHDGQIGKHGFQIHDSSSIIILVINISSFYSRCKEAPAFGGSQPVFGSAVSGWPPPTRSRIFSSAFCRSSVMFRVVHPALSAISLAGMSNTRFSLRISRCWGVSSRRAALTGDAGDWPADDLRPAPKRPGPQGPDGTALSDPQGGGDRLAVRNRRKDLKKSSAQGNITRPWTDVLYCERRNL